MRRIAAVLMLSLPFVFAAAPAGAPATAPAAVPPVVAVKGKLGKPEVLFNGKDLTGWTWHANVAGTKVEDVWSVKDGFLHSMSKPKSTGYLEAEKVYKNFVLTVEYKHLTKDNGGVFICITGEEKVWPNAIQIQGKWAAVGDLINQNSGMQKMTTDPARTKTVNKDVVISRIAPAAPIPATWKGEMPLNEWNTLVITMEDGNLNVTNNGVLLNTASDVKPDAGKVGIQAEGAEMEFRKVELTPIE